MQDDRAARPESKADYMETGTSPRKTSPPVGAASIPMKRSPTPITKFPIGAARPESKVDYAMKRGMVMEAKQKLEDKIRKERREKKIEEVRKPLLATPTR